MTKYERDCAEKEVWRALSVEVSLILKSLLEFLPNEELGIDAAPGNECICCRVGAGSWINARPESRGSLKRFEGRLVGVSGTFTVAAETVDQAVAQIGAHAHQCQREVLELVERFCPDRSRAPAERYQIHTDGSD